LYADTLIFLDSRDYQKPKFFSSNFWKDPVKRKCLFSIFINNVVDFIVDKYKPFFLVIYDPINIFYTL